MIYTLCGDPEIGHQIVTVDKNPFRELLKLESPPRLMFLGGRPAAAKKDWMNTHMTFDSLEPRRSLLKVGHQEYLTLKSSGNWPPD